MIIKAYAVPHPPIILPEVGRGEERRIENTTLSFQRMAHEIELLAPDTIVLSSPHAPAYADGFYIAGGDGGYGDLRLFGIPHVREEVSLDRTFSERLAVTLADRGIYTTGTMQGRGGFDHGTLIPLRFIHQRFTDFKLVLLGISWLGSDVHREVGKVVARIAEELKRRVVFIASGDLSHVLKKDGPYGYRPEGPVFDAEIARIFREGDLEALFHFDPAILEEAAECGLRSFQMMAGVLDGAPYESELYSYEGTFGVGYAVASVTPKRIVGDEDMEEHRYD
ncbi:MAG TPA: AmmeMemoRadiSam system protein B [Bacillota bacterium]|jgi:aromatic ring-opening dioxygenase LigB subunit|nr:AmmeMemoRadiSam system protein B [Bacillota bacterium]HQC48370.1 AmmeMemoRadiSam system protein B [Bacillota bacterium]